MRPGVTLYFVRHGQTEWNRTRRIQGQIDAPLNDTGREQAERNGRTLAGLGLDIATMPFVASPLTRCRETMEIVRATVGVDPEGYRTDDRLKEVHFGTWQGHYWYELAELYPDQCTARTADPFNWRPDDGESYADLTARAAAWLSEIEHDTICVSHGGVSRALRGLALGLPETEIPELPVPQDKVLVLRRNEMEWI